jgi:hypothetical protein
MINSEITALQKTALAPPFLGKKQQEKFRV